MSATVDHHDWPATMSFAYAWHIGLVSIYAIDDWVDAWHQGRGVNERATMELDEYLGFTHEQGGRWAAHPSELPAILNEARQAILAESKNTP